MSKYDDIIGYLHFHEKGRPYMNMNDRAAQFKPFKSRNEYVNYVGKKSDEIIQTKDPHYIVTDIENEYN